MPQMNINIKNIFATPDKFVTVKRINIMIEIGILTPEGIKIFMQLFLRWISKQGLDDSIHLITVVSLMIGYIIPNVSNYK